MSLLGSCLYPRDLALIGLVYVYLVAQWMHTNSSDMFLFSFVLKCVGERDFPLGAELKELYIKVAFINIIYVT